MPSHCLTHEDIAFGMKELLWLHVLTVNADADLRVLLVFNGAILEQKLRNRHEVIVEQGDITLDVKVRKHWLVRADRACLVGTEFRFLAYHQVQTAAGFQENIEVVI